MARRRNARRPDARASLRTVNDALRDAGLDVFLLRAPRRDAGYLYLAGPDADHLSEAGFYGGERVGDYTVAEWVAMIRERIAERGGPRPRGPRTPVPGPIRLRR
jgi:hypothetical protein